ncbi:thioredoxin family protein [Bacillus massilinigeriensis]|uniref:thioredoxin family protein n=1 Tax=Bacillus mediterraneensis TaxID=1805474 RepID=UPI0008F8A94F|nr:thioredoxin family protein [Bacillus mediterraneensis]
MEEWSKEKILDLLQSRSDGILYFYTPLCGTCRVAGNMLDITVTMFPEIPSGKTDLNFTHELAKQFGIESVPCLILLKNGNLEEKIYAFQSVPYLYEEVKKIFGSVKE